MSTPARSARPAVPRTTTIALAVALLYILAGKAGLLFAFLQVSASPIWPPTGIALAALLLFGYTLSPVVFVAAFVVNVTTAGSVATSLGIALGNTLEAVIGAWLINRFAGGAAAFERARPPGRDLRLVALTGYGLSEDRARAVAAGYDAHVVKPIDLDKLQEILAGSPRTTS